MPKSHMASTIYEMKSHILLKDQLQISKIALKMAMARIKLLRNKKEVQVHQMRREVAQLLEGNQDQTTRIRVEHVIREEKFMHAYDLIEVYCKLIVARMSIIDSQNPINTKPAGRRERGGLVPHGIEADGGDPAEAGSAGLPAHLVLMVDWGCADLAEIANFLGITPSVDTEAIQYDYNPNEDYAETEFKLRKHLQSFLETVKSFNMIYTKEIHPWTHMMEVPQLHGFGPAANRLLEAYYTLLKFLGNLRSLRDSYTAMAAGSLSNSSEPSSVIKIISECESALTFLNNSLAILSTFVARERGETL